MATPSSSATTPSPKTRYRQSTASASTATVVPNGVLSAEGDDRERLAQKITADAQLGELALSLRARLFYANYKVKNNTTNHTLHELDSQLSAAGKHTPNGKRAANYFNDPGSPSGGQSSRSGARRGSMAPPPPVTASAAQSLFSSLLAPPPAKRARTIHNPDDPPVAAPEKAIKQVRSPRPAKVTRTPDSHAKSKSKKAAKEKASAPPSGKGKGKGKQRVTAEGSFEPAHNTAEDREIDMQAAATLTTLLLNQQRPSVSATAGSPRSSISAGSDPGSTHSFAHYAQSSTRTAAGGTSAQPSQQSLFARATRSAATPPHSPALSQASPAVSHAKARRSSVAHGSSLRHEGAGTPKMTPRDRVDDTDAADMLLLMATSPSPARPSNSRDRDARDAAAFHALRGGGSGLKGRVLFPSYGGDEGGGSRTSRTLSREMSGSFASVSSTATEPVSPRMIPVRRDALSQPLSRLSTTDDAPQAGSSGYLGVPMLPTITPPTPTDQVPSELLPPALPSSQQPQSRSISRSVDHPPSSSSSINQNKTPLPPRTPHASFNLSDYMHVSPSPAATMTLSRSSSGVQSPAGRRLFEEHYGANGSKPSQHQSGQPPPPSQ